MSQNYKDFSSLNQHLAENPTPSCFNNLLRFMNLVGNFKTSSQASKLPVDWSRAYAGVMVLKYASDGTPTDVTSDVTGNGLTVPDCEIARVKANADDLMNQIEELSNQLKFPVSSGKLGTFDLSLGLVERPGGFTDVFHVCNLIALPDSRAIVVSYNIATGVLHLELKNLPYSIGNNVIGGLAEIVLNETATSKSSIFEGSVITASLAGAPSVRVISQLMIHFSYNEAVQNPDGNMVAQLSNIHCIIVTRNENNDIVRRLIDSNQVVTFDTINTGAQGVDLSSTKLTNPLPVQCAKFSAEMNMSAEADLSDVFQDQIDNCRSICDDLSQLMGNS